MENNCFFIKKYISKHKKNKTKDVLYIIALYYCKKRRTPIYTRFFISSLFLSNCTRFYKMIKQLLHWQIFGNSTDKQLISFLLMNKKIIACTNLKMNEFERKLYLKNRDIENMTQLLCLKLHRLTLFIQVNVLLFLLLYFF